MSRCWQGIIGGFVASRKLGKMLVMPYENYLILLNTYNAYIIRILIIETYVIINRSCLISLLTPYPLAARWKVSGVISISEHRTTATVSKNSRNSASSSALKWKKILWNVYESLREKQYDSFVILVHSWIMYVCNIKVKILC